MQLPFRCSDIEVTIEEGMGSNRDKDELMLGLLLKAELPELEICVELCWPFCGLVLLVIEARAHNSKASEILLSRGTLADVST